MNVFLGKCIWLSCCKPFPFLCGSRKVHVSFTKADKTRGNRERGVMTCGIIMCNTCITASWWFTRSQFFRNPLDNVRSVWFNTPFFFFFFLMVYYHLNNFLPPYLCGKVIPHFNLFLKNKKIQKLVRDHLTT
jgi:hypothetical protein